MKRQYSFFNKIAKLAQKTALTPSPSPNNGRGAGGEGRFVLALVLFPFGKKTPDLCKIGCFFVAFYFT